MKIVFIIAHLVITTALISVILLQTKGVGLSSTFGGEGSFYRSRRGVEKILLYASVLLSGLFVVTSLVGLLI